ncbi:CcmD family protein [Methanolobus vulcani]|uniref:CcmD family protein n=1 Tax=Methanolobus vulcani TaxID=38026 RepID=A0A7Z8KPQ5_9EURY|nr:CcmD family protein [Methanolobus vulcani]
MGALEIAFAITWITLMLYLAYIISSRRKLMRQFSRIEK